MRFPQAAPSRFGGSEWVEPEPAEPEIAEMPGAFGFNREQELPADFALDLRLHEILDHAIRFTPATAAVIALASGDKMVCRATAGEKTPSAGAFLNAHSGLSGLCVQTQEMQSCDDTLTDPRVNAEACRALGIRSIVVLPILEATRLRGILEVFCSSPCAFSNDNIETLQALGRRVSQTVQDAVEGGSTILESGSWSGEPEADANDPVPAAADQLVDESRARETLAREIVGSALKAVPVKRRDYRNAALTTAVIGLALLLGWMVGRVGWSMAVSHPEAQLSITPEEAQAAAQATAQTSPQASSPVSQAASQPAPQETTSPDQPVASGTGKTGTGPASSEIVTPSSKPVSKPKKEAVQSAGGLVVYEQGKVVFRGESTAKSSAAASDASPVQTAAAREGDVSTSSESESSPNGKYLLERVEPVYPEAARQQNIHGAVVLAALVGTDGAVRELRVVSGEPVLAKAATDAVRRWRFQPHRQDGRLVEFETQITVNFALPQ
jgi:TonB family protein